MSLFRDIMNVPSLTGKCDLCGCIQPLTEHHLIPRTLHHRKWFKKNFKKEDMRTRKALLCYECHKYLHQQWTEKELGRDFNTMEKIKAEEKVHRFIKWVRKQKR